MKVRVKLISGRSFLVTGATIGKLKESLYPLVKIPPSQQAIFYLGEVRDDEENVKLFGDDPEFILKFLLEPPSTITIKTLAGEETKFKVYLNITKVKHLRKLCRSKFGVAQDQFKFLYGRKELQNDEILEKYGIKDQSVIQVILILQGGK